MDPKPPQAHYMIRPGYARNPITFTLAQEEQAAHVWSRVRRDADAAFWFITAGGVRLGTRDFTELRQNDRGRFLNCCQECRKDFFTNTTRSEPLCQGCELLIRAGEVYAKADSEHDRIRRHRTRNRLHVVPAYPDRETEPPLPDREKK